MACRLLLKDLSRDEKEKIIKDCTITPAETEYGQSSQGVFCCDVVKPSKPNDPEYIYIPYSYVYHYLTKHYKDYPNEDLIFKKWKTDLEFSIPLFDRQKSVIPEICETLSRTHTVCISLSCGYGKTFLSIFLATKLKFKVLMTVFREELLEQYRESILIACPKAIIQILDSTCKMNPDAHFYLIGIISLPKRSRSDYLGIGTFIVDEFHTTLSPVFSRALLHICPKYVIGLSATPYKTDFTRLIEYHFGIEIIYRELYRPYNIYIIESGFKPIAESNKQGKLDWHSILRQQAEDNDLSLLIVDIVKFFQAREIMVLCKRVDQSKKILSLLKEEKIDCDIFAENKKKYNKACRVLIVTYSKGGVGFDAPKTNMLIIAGDVATSFIQYLGRTFRSNDIPIVVDFRHKQFTMNQHLNLGRSITYSVTGGEIRDFDKAFPEFELWRSGEHYFTSDIIIEKIRKIREEDKQKEIDDKKIKLLKENEAKIVFDE